MLAAVSGPGRGGDEVSWIPAFPVRVWNRLEEAGCADPVSLLRIVSQTAEISSPSKFYLLH